MAKPKQNRSTARGQTPPRDQTPARGRVPTRQTGTKQLSKGVTDKNVSQPEATSTPSAKSPSPVATTGPRAETLTTGRRISWWALLAMVFLVPLATSNFTVLGFDSPFTDDVFELVKVALLRILTCVALAAWAWDLLRRGGRIRHTPVNWLVLAFIIWVAITTATSIHWPTALLGKPNRHEGLVAFMNYGVIYFLLLQLADHASRVRRLAQSLFWSSVIVAAFGIAQYLGLGLAGWQPVGFEADRAFSTYGNPDFLGGFLIFSMTTALGLALLEQRTVRRLAYWLGFALNGAALVVAFARGAWIGGVVSLALLGVIAWRQRARLKRVDWVPAGASLAVGVALIVRSLSSKSEVLNFGKRIASIFEFSSGSGYSRTEIWRAALSAIKDRPVLGSGADTFRLVFHRFKTPEYVRFKGGSSGADNAHDYLLQLATGIGIPGALMFAGIFIWAAIRSAATVFRRSEDVSRIMVGAFWAAAAGYLIHLLFGLSLPSVSFLLWISLAVVLVPTARLIQMRAHRWGAIVGTIIILCAALGIAYQAVALAADNAFQRSQTAASTREKIDGAVRAVELNPLNADYRQGVGLAYLAEMHAYLQAGTEAYQRGEDTTQYREAVRRSFTDGESALKEAIQFIPDEYDNYVVLATLYNLGGQAVDEGLYHDAIEVANQALEIMPLGTTARLQLAQALVATGQVTEAVETLEYCMELDPADGDVAYSLASLYRQLGQEDKALVLLRSVEALLPGQPGIADAIKEIEAGKSGQ